MATEASSRRLDSKAKAAVAFAALAFALQVIQPFIRFATVDDSGEHRSEWYLWSRNFAPPGWERQIWTALWVLPLAIGLILGVALLVRGHRQVAGGLILGIGFLQCLHLTTRLLEIRYVLSYAHMPMGYWCSLVVECLACVALFLSAWYCLRGRGSHEGVGRSQDPDVVRADRAPG
jgi:hypothetical protein